jgi:nucleoside-diphosphate-sugar epimerase
MRDMPASLHLIIAFSSMSAESKRDSLDPTERELAKRLHDSEEQLLTLGDAHESAITIFRPTLIYGAGTDRSLTPLARFASRWHVLPIPLAATGLRQPVHAEDLADACFAVLDRPISFGRIYPLGGGERLSFRAVCRRIGAGLPKTVLPLPLPSWLLRAALLLRGNAKFGAVSTTAMVRLRHDLVADNSAAAHDFGFTPRSFYPLAASWGLPAV